MPIKKLCRKSWTGLLVWCPVDGAFDRDFYRGLQVNILIHRPRSRRQPWHQPWSELLIAASTIVCPCACVWDFWALFHLVSASDFNFQFIIILKCTLLYWLHQTWLPWLLNDLKPSFVLVPTAVSFRTLRILIALYSKSSCWNMLV